MPSCSFSPAQSRPPMIHQSGNGFTHRRASHTACRDLSTMMASVVTTTNDSIALAYVVSSRYVCDMTCFGSSTYLLYKVTYLSAGLTRNERKNVIMKSHLCQGQVLISIFLSTTHQKRENTQPTCRMFPRSPPCRLGPLDVDAYRRTHR